MGCDSILRGFSFSDSHWRSSPYLGHAVLMAHGRQCESQPLNGIYHICSHRPGHRKSHGETQYQWNKEEYSLMGENCRVKMYNLLTRNGKQIIKEIIKSTTFIKNRSIGGIEVLEEDIFLSSSWQARELINESTILTKTLIRQKRKKQTVCVISFCSRLLCFQSLSSHKM